MPTEAGLVPTITPVRLRRTRNNPIMRQDPTGMLDVGVLEDGNPGGSTHTKRLPAPDLNNPDPKLDRSPFPGIVARERAPSNGDWKYLADADVFPSTNSSWMQITWRHLKAFGYGLVNAAGSDFFFGVGREYPHGYGELPSTVKLGQSAGDLIALLAGVSEIIGGLSMMLGGGGLSLSGVGAVPGVLVISTGYSLVAHGYGSMVSALKGLFENSKTQTSNQMSEGSNGAHVIMEEKLLREVTLEKLSTRVNRENI